jgi:uncharacterized protein YkwD
MKMRVALVIASVLLSWTASAAPRDGESFFTEYDERSFRKLPIANQPIDPERVNRQLLDAAVFHETNRRRAAENLEPLRYDARARKAAAIQSRAMAKAGVVSHENPKPDASSLTDRARLAGLTRPAFLAENVASAFGRRYRSGEKFYVREENGRKVYSAEPDGPPIPMHTYLSFASALVDSWMSSPGHRKNILASEARFLGCSCVRGEERTALDIYYCAQVFYRPLR